MKSLDEISKGYDFPIDCSHSDLYIPNSKKNGWKPECCLWSFGFLPRVDGWVSIHFSSLVDHGTAAEHTVSWQTFLLATPGPWDLCRFRGVEKEPLALPGGDARRRVEAENPLIWRTKTWFLLGRIDFRMFTSSVLNYNFMFLHTQPPYPTPLLPSLITSYLICYPIYEVQPFFSRLKRTKYSATSAHSGLGSWPKSRGWCLLLK